MSLPTVPTLSRQILDRAPGGGRFLAFLLFLLLAAAPLGAQAAGDEDERDDERPDGVPGLRVDPEVLDEERRRAEGETEEGVAPLAIPDGDDAPSREEHMRRVNLQLLGRYPGAAAQTLLEELIARGPASTPFLIECLSDPDAKVRLAAVHGLKELRDPTSFAPLRAAASEKGNLARLEAFADAMIAVDRPAGLAQVAKYLESHRSIVRHHARDALLAHLRVDEADAVLAPYFDSKEGEARQLALQAIVHLQPQASTGRCLAALRDEFPGVAYEAASALAKHGGAGELAQLHQLVLDWGHRSGAYALLALVIAEDTRGDRLFDEALATKVIEAFRMEDPLDRGAAAIAMANLGGWKEDGAFLELLNRRVVPVLIDTVSSTTYYADHQVLRELVLRKLVALSGKNFSYDWNGWRAWWLDNRNSFTAQRGLKTPQSIDPDHATVRWLATGGESEPIDVLLAAFAPEEKRGEALRLSKEDMGALLDGIAYEGFFDLPENIGDDASSIKRVTIVVQGEGRTKAVTMLGSPRGTKAEIFARIANMLAELRSRNLWQRYHDRIRSPDAGEWWFENYKWWSSGPEGEQAARRLRSMIISSIDQLPITWREGAFRDLAIANQRCATPIGEGEAYDIIAPLGDGDLSAAQASLLVDMLAAAAHRPALAPTIASIISVSAYDGQALVAKLLKGYGRAATEDFISHGDDTVRAAASVALGTLGPADDRAFELLQKRIEDRVPAVQAAAAFGIGLLRNERGIEPLRKLLETSDRMVKQSALAAMGKIGGPRAVEVLVPFAADKDRLVRQSALTALGACGDANAVYALLGALRSETSPIGRRIVSDALAAFPGPEARLAVLAQLQQEKDSAAQVALIEALAVMPPPADAKTDEAAILLRRISREVSGEVHEAAVLALSRMGDVEAVPSLIALLEQGENPRALAALRRLTYQDFGSGAASTLAESYREWWQGGANNKSWKWWLLDALAAHGYSPIGLYEVLSDGEQAMKGVPTFIDALTDDNRELRHGAVRLLAEITGQDFGDPERATDDLSVAIIAAKWRSWLETRGK